MADYLTDNGCPLSATEASAMDYKSADKSAANRIGSTSAAANTTSTAAVRKVQCQRTWAPGKIFASVLVRKKT